MTVIYLVLPLALLLAIAALLGFYWALRSGQLDDLDTPSVRMLVDDEPGGAGGHRGGERGGRNERGERR